MTEAALQKQILEALRLSPKIGGVQRINTGGRTRRTNLAPTGTPDIFGWMAISRDWSGTTHKGQAFWIEVKTPKGKLNADQAAFLEHAASTGCITLVARSLEDIQWLI